MNTEVQELIHIIWNIIIVFTKVIVCIRDLDNFNFDYLDFFRPDIDKFVLIIS